MSFLSLILRNILRQRIRTALTVVGISVGITTVVALGIITGGMKASTEQLITLGDADFMVAQKGSADLMLSSVSDADLQEIRARDDVEWAGAIAIQIARVGSNPYFVLSGVDLDHSELIPENIIAGRTLSGEHKTEIMLGERAADDLGYAVGDIMTIEHRDFQVVGVYRTDVVMLNGGGFTTLDTIQEINNQPGIMTAFFVKVSVGSDPLTVAAAIEDGNSRLTSVATVDDIGEVDQGMLILDSMNLAISVLAVGIGAIGVMNTMIMSVFERTREIGILRAVGWSGQRILRMIVTESLLLCLIASVVGIALGIGATRLVMTIDTIRAFLEPEYSLALFARALIVGVVVALAGAAYPAFRAVRLTPMEALRHE